jgi:hypothetical protein
MKRTILAAGAAVGIAAVSLIATAGTASAATTTTSNGQITRTTGVHNAPSRQAPAITTLAAGTAINAWCFVPSGQDGNEIWFRIDTGTPGGGWVPRDVTIGVPTNLPGC